MNCKGYMQWFNNTEGPQIMDFFRFLAPGISNPDIFFREKRYIPDNGHDILRFDFILASLVPPEGRVINLIFYSKRTYSTPGFFHNPKYSGKESGSVPYIFDGDVNPVQDIRAIREGTIYIDVFRYLSNHAVILTFHVAKSKHLSKTGLQYG